MSAIILEVLALLAGITGITMLVRAGASRTRPGVRLQQEANRRAIEQRAALTCPIHGLQAEETLVRLPDGGTLCAACYQEALVDHPPS